jgi:SOS response regulatory protein OraA/RecX
MPLPRSRKRSNSQRHPANSDPRADPAAVQAAAVTLLARRDFASAELRARLRSQGFDEGVAGNVIAELAARGVLDDRRFAENYVTWPTRTRTRSTPRTPRNSA